MDKFAPKPVTVITGFLGSGKTTLLSALLKKEEMKNVAVIINEFGEVGLDHALVENSDENIVELQNGCICCTIQGDLQKTMLGLINKMTKGEISYFDKVIIETTGLADPVPVIHTLISSMDLQRIYTLDGVITVVDATNGEKTLDLQPEAVKQAALAERIIISKIDLVEKDKELSLETRLRTINPSIKIIKSSFGAVSISDLINLGAYDPFSKGRDVKEWLAAESMESHHDHDDHHVNVNRHDENIEAFSMTSEKPVNMMAFALFKDLLMAQMGPDLLRLKGIINIEGKDRPAVIHGVQHIFHPVHWLEKWPDGDRQTKLVFITRNVKKEQIEGFFNALMGLVGDKSMPKEIADLL
ncbi:GTP-binding protein [Paracoccaceae bacterium]|nr:GTP-binding protein [Paracoccaceae bacterium]